MSQTYEYCDDEHDVSDTVFVIVSRGFGYANKDHKPFCSVECRTWWRRRCSDNPGAWEQPMQPGYQGCLNRFVSDDTGDPNADESATQPATIAASEGATVEAEA